MGLLFHTANASVWDNGSAGGTIHGTEHRTQHRTPSTGHRAHDTEYKVESTE